MEEAKAMEVQYSKWQTQRRCAPDDEVLNHMLLIKGCSKLNLTYQIHYLAEKAEREGSTFVLRVRKGCRLSAELRGFLKACGSTKLERF